MTVTTDNSLTKITTVRAALTYLNSMGWKVSEKTFYRHIEKAKIGPKPWQKEDLDIYALQFLKPAAESKAKIQAQPALRKSAQEYLNLRKDKIEIETRLKKFDFELKKGNYISAEDHVKLFCMKLNVMKEVIRNWIYEHALEMISACHGDPKYISEVINIYQDGFESYLSRLDTDKKILILKSDLDKFMEQK